MGGPKPQDQYTEMDVCELQSQHCYTDPPSPLIGLFLEQGILYPHLVPGSHLAFATVQQLSRRRIPDLRRSHRRTSKGTHAQKTSRSLMHVGTQDRRGRVECTTKEKRSEAVSIQETIHHSSKWDEHPANTLAHSQVLQGEANNALFSHKNQSLEHHCNELKGSDKQYCISTWTTIDDQFRITRLDTRVGNDKNAATCNTFPS